MTPASIPITIITDYVSKYYAHALTGRSFSDSLEKLGTSLLNATVDLNPHQIEAALFAIRSPLSLSGAHPLKCAARRSCQRAADPSVEV